MNKYILFALIFCSFSIYAQDSQDNMTVDVTEEIIEKEKEEEIKNEVEPPQIIAPAPVTKSETIVEESEDFYPRGSHWYSIFNFEAMEYELPFSYVGTKQSFSVEKRQLYGGRVGFGGEVYLGAGFMTSVRVDGYYMGTFFRSAKTADPELDDLDVASVKDAGQIYGADAVGTFSFMWDMKTKNPFMDQWSYLTVEPFVEAGVGRAWAFNKKDYNYDTTVIVEEYDQSFNDELVNNRFGGGINFTSKTGFFLTLKATQNRYDITKRRTKGYFYASGNASADVDPNPSTELKPIMIYSLGGGYRF
jgi:hypothetical protein